MFTINEQIKTLVDEKVSTGLISERKLVYGLCTRDFLGKLMRGEANADLRMVQVLVQRLGKSPNKLEFILPKEAIDTRMRQLAFQDYIDQNDHIRAKELLEEYHRLAKKEEKFDVFYYLRNKAEYEYYMLGDKEAALKSVEEAVELTLPDWKKKGLEKLVISTTEMEGLLFYTYLKYDRDGIYQQGLEETEKLKQYIEARITDKEEYASIMPKACFLLAKLYIGEKAYKKAVEQCEKGFEHLRRYALLHLMLPFLDILVRYGEGEALREPYENYVKYRKILKELLEEYGFSSHKYDSFFVRCDKAVYHYDAEMISGQRKNLGLSQERLADKANVAPEMVSRYEHGKQSPNKTTFPKVMDALGLEYRKQNTMLISNDFRVMEKAEEIIIMICKDEYKQAEEEIQELGKMLDHSYRRNEKIIQNLKCSVDVGKGSADYEAFLQKGRSLLEETYPTDKERLNRPPFLDEAKLITQIAVCHNRLNQNKEASKIYEKVMEAVESSYVDTRLRIRIYSLYLSNYAQIAFKKEEVVTGIRYCIECRSISNMERQVSNLAISIYENNMAKSKELMENAMYFALLLKKKNNYKIIQSNIEKYY